MGFLDSLKAKTEAKTQADAAAVQEAEEVEKAVKTSAAEYAQRRDSLREKLRFSASLSGSEATERKTELNHLVRLNKKAVAGALDELENTVRTAKAAGIEVSGQEEQEGRIEVIKDATTLGLRLTRDLMHTAEGLRDATTKLDQNFEEMTEKEIADSDHALADKDVEALKKMGAGIAERVLTQGEALKKTRQEIVDGYKGLNKQIREEKLDQKLILSQIEIRNILRDIFKETDEEEIRKATKENFIPHMAQMVADRLQADSKSYQVFMDYKNAYDKILPLRLDLNARADKYSKDVRNHSIKIGDAKRSEGIDKMIYGEDSYQFGPYEQNASLKTKDVRVDQMSPWLHEVVDTQTINNLVFKKFGFKKLFF